MAKSNRLGRRKHRIRELEGRVATLEGRVDAIDGEDDEHKQFPLAHIVRPAADMQRAKNGEDVKALCGAKLTRDPLGDTAVCRDCFLLNLIEQEKESQGWIDKAREESRALGHAAGLREGETNAMKKIREAAEARKEELEPAAAAS